MKRVKLLISLIIFAVSAVMSYAAGGTAMVSAQYPIEDPNIIWFYDGTNRTVLFSQTGSGSFDGTAFTLPAGVKDVPYSMENTDIQNNLVLVAGNSTANVAVAMWYNSASSVSGAAGIPIKLIHWVGAPAVASYIFGAADSYFTLSFTDNLLVANAETATITRANNPTVVKGETDTTSSINIAGSGAYTKNYYQLLYNMSNIVPTATGNITGVMAMSFIFE